MVATPNPVFTKTFFLVSRLITILVATKRTKLNLNYK